MVHSFSNSPRLILPALARKSSVIHDEEFGDIEIHRVRGNILRLKIQTNGAIVAQLPHFTSVREVERLLEKSRENLRHNLKQMPTKKSYRDGDAIGKSHTLRLRDGVRADVKLKDLDIIVTIPQNSSGKARETLIKTAVEKSLRKEAKAYLPRELKYLAMKFGFHYERVQFTHAKSRWGSCSSTGTISLNIMLMTLPQELLDYVLLHELNHTIHMDHSAEFWTDLEKICPRAKLKRKKLRAFSPYL